MTELNVKLAAYKSLRSQQDRFAAFTDCHKDWQRNNEIDLELARLHKDIMGLGGQDELEAILLQFKAEEDAADRRLEELNRKMDIEMMYIQYQHQYGWHDLDEQDQRFEDRFGELWLQHRDDIWEKVCPKHRAKKYAQDAIADSKLPEVCHD